MPGAFWSADAGNRPVDVNRLRSGIPQPPSPVAATDVAESSAPSETSAAPLLMITPAPKRRPLEKKNILPEPCAKDAEKDDKSKAAASSSASRKVMLPTQKPRPTKKKKSLLRITGPPKDLRAPYCGMPLNHQDP